MRKIDTMSCAKVGISIVYVQSRAKRPFEKRDNKRAILFDDMVSSGLEDNPSNPLGSLSRLLNQLLIGPLEAVFAALNGCFADR